MPGKPNHRQTTSIVAAVLLAAAFFMMTNPSRLPAAAFIAAFGLLFAIGWLLVGLGLKLAGYSSANQRQRYLVALAISGICTALLGLSSIGQLTGRDILTLAIFFGLLYFYGSRFVCRGNQ